MTPLDWYIYIAAGVGTFNIFFNTARILQLARLRLRLRKYPRVASAARSPTGAQIDIGPRRDVNCDDP